MPEAACTSFATLSMTGFQDVELRLGRDQRDHHLRDNGRAGALAHRDGCLEDGPRLHLRDFGIGDREPAAAMAEHRVLLLELVEAGTQRDPIHVQRLGQFRDLRVAMGQELVQRRIEQADRDRQARHDLEQLDEVLLLHRQDFGKRRTAAFLILGHDHLAHGNNPVGVEEHMLGAAEPDAFGAEFARLGRVRRRVGIGADLHAPQAVGPLHQRAEVAGQLRLAHLHRALDDLAVRRRRW